MLRIIIHKYKQQIVNKYNVHTVYFDKNYKSYTFFTILNTLHSLNCHISHFLFGWFSTFHLNYEAHSMPVTSGATESTTLYEQTQNREKLCAFKCT